MAPTAPDTLGAYPQQEQDPFVIEEAPHVFFAGNQDKFAVEKLTGMLVAENTFLFDLN